MMSLVVNLKRLFNFDAGGVSGLASFRPKPPFVNKRVVLGLPIRHSASRVRTSRKLVFKG